LPVGIGFNDAKSLFKSLQKERVMSAAQIYSYICERKEQALVPLSNILRAFLSRRV
jgi:hypothetical protein